MSDDRMVEALKAKIDALQDEILALLDGRMITDEIGAELYRLLGEIDVLRLRLADLA